MSTVTFRKAERKDVALILEFIQGLAAYEKMENEVVADEALLEEWIFDKQKAEVFSPVRTSVQMTAQRRLPSMFSGKISMFGSASSFS